MSQRVAGQARRRRPTADGDAAGSGESTMTAVQVPEAKAGAARRSTKAATAGFDRLRPRAGRPAPPAVAGPRPGGAIGRDTHGKRALYSGERPPDPKTSGVTVHCSRCSQATTVGPRRALLILTPSLHLPLIRPRYPSLLRCPACRKVSWARLALTVHRDG